MDLSGAKKLSTVHWHGGSGPATDLLLAAALPTRLLLTTLTAAAVPSTPIYKVRYSERCDGATREIVCVVVGESEKIKSERRNSETAGQTAATTERERLRDGTDWRIGRPAGRARASHTPRATSARPAAVNG